MTASEGPKNQLSVAANSLTINIWGIKFHSRQKKAAARETENCPEGRHSRRLAET